MSPQQRVLLVVVSLLVILTGVGQAAPTGPADREATRCGPPSDPDHSPHNGTWAPPNLTETEDTTVAYGDVAVVPLTLPDGRNGTVSLEGTNGSVEIAVADDGDGRIGLAVNTYALDAETDVPGRAVWATGADTARLGDGSVTLGQPDGGAVPDERVRLGLRLRHDGSVVGTWTVVVTEPSVRTVTLRRGLTQLFDAPAAEIRERVRAGDLRRLPADDEYNRSVVVEGETLVARADAPSLLGVLAAQAGGTSTERLRRMSSVAEAPVRLDTDGPCGGVLLPETIDAGGARVLADYRNGSVSLVLDTATLRGIDDAYRVELVADGNGWTAGDDALGLVEQSVETTERSFSVSPVDGEMVQLSASENATVTVETALPNGSALPVVVTSRLRPAVEWRTTAVVENGMATATLDLASASNPGVFRLAIDGTRYRAEIGDAGTYAWALSDFDADAASLDVDGMRMPGSGFKGLLVAYRYDDGTFRPVDAVQEPKGELQLLTAPDEPTRYLLVAHRDAATIGEFDGLATDEPSRVGGRPVQQWLRVGRSGVETGADAAPSGPVSGFDPDRVVTEGSPTPTTTDRSTTETPTTTGRSTTETVQTAAPASAAQSTTPAPGSTTSGDGPGFGLAAAVAGLLAGLALFARR